MCTSHRPLSIARSSIGELAAAATFPELAAEYAAEAAIPGLPKPDAKQATYLALEQSGLLHTLAATIGAPGEGRLIGFITLLVPVMPHYGVPVAVAESFFVAKAWRGTGAGLRLLGAAEELARDLGAPGLLVSAPIRGDLVCVLPRRGYVEANRVFFKQVGHA